jgi:hypothetical protein
VSRSLSDFFRSIAYQMANSNAAVREKFTQMRNEGSTFDVDDDWTIWTNLFKRGIFQVSTLSRSELFGIGSQLLRRSVPIVRSTGS